MRKFRTLYDKPINPPDDDYDEVAARQRAETARDEMLSANTDFELACFEDAIEAIASDDEKCRKLKIALKNNAVWYVSALLLEYLADHIQDNE